MRLIIAALAAAIFEAGAQVPPVPPLPPPTPVPTPRAAPPAPPSVGVPTPAPWPAPLPGQSAEWREHERAMRELELDLARRQRELERAWDADVRAEQLRIEREIRARELDQRAWERELRAQDLDREVRDRALRADIEARMRDAQWGPTPRPVAVAPLPPLPSTPGMPPLPVTPPAPAPSEYDIARDRALAPPRPFRPRTPGDVPPESWLPQDPADSIYNRARTLLNRDQNRSAAEAFRSIPQRFPNSGYAPISMYWEAVALYRIGGQNELEQALEVLERQRQRFPNATNPDPALATTIRGELARRGNSTARNQLRTTAAGAQQGPTCDRNQMAIRIEALNAVSRMMPDSTTPIIRGLLAQRDECSERLRQQAIMLLARRSDATTTDLLIEVIKNDPSIEVRRAAVTWLGESPSDRGIAALEEILRTPTDAALHSAALRAISNARNPRATQAIKGTIERSDASEQVRRDAISALARADSAGAGAYLRGIYARLDSPRVKETALTTIARLPGDENKRWLADLVRNPAEPVAVRQSVLRVVTRSSNTTLTEITALYAAVPELELKQQIISSLGDRKEPEVVPQLIDMYRRTTDTKLQLQIVNSLARRDDPRAKQFLIDILK